MTAVADVRQIAANCHGRYAEAIASGACSPGHLLERDTNLKVLKATSVAGPLIVATEHNLEGQSGLGTVGLMDAYAIGDIVPHVYPKPGDRVYVRVPAGAAAITKSNYLTGNGAGQVIKVNGNGVIFNSVAASTAISNTDTSEHDFSVTGTIPASTLKAGDVVTVKGQAVVSAAAGTDTLTIKVYLGSTVILLGAAVNATTGDIIHFSVDIAIRTIGDSGTYIASGYVYNGAAGTGTAVVGGVGSTSIDTTAAQTVKASATWSATTSTCTVALQRLSATVVPDTTKSLFQAEETVDNSAGSDEVMVLALVL